MPAKIPSPADRITVGGALCPDKKRPLPSKVQNRGIKPLLQFGIGHDFSGAVLAGGKSSRMGRNKALLRINGEALWRRQLRVLKEAGANPVWLVQAPGQRALTRGVLRDSVSNAGPLAGLHAALAQCRSGHVAVVAVDLPHIERAWFARLAKLCAPGIGAVARTRNGYEPLAAIYPREALTEVEARLSGGEFALQALIQALVRSRQMRVVRLKSAELGKIANWNTPRDIDLLDPCSTPAPISGPRHFKPTKS